MRFIGRGTASDKPCTLVEAHAPACDPLVRDNALGLFAKDETPNLSTAVNTVRTYEIDPNAIEMRALGLPLT